MCCRYVALKTVLIPLNHEWAQVVVAVWDYKLILKSVSGWKQTNKRVCVACFKKSFKWRHFKLKRWCLMLDFSNLRKCRTILQKGKVSWNLLRFQHFCLTKIGSAVSEFLSEIFCPKKEARCRNSLMNMRAFVLIGEFFKLVNCYSDFCSLVKVIRNFCFNFHSSWELELGKYPFQHNETLFQTFLFQQSFFVRFRREALRLMIEANEQSQNSFYEKRSNSLCCSNRNRRHRNNRGPRSTGGPYVNPSAVQVLTYEEVGLFTPEEAPPRPVILVGPSKIGRHELRQRLYVRQPEYFGFAVPRKLFTCIKWRQLI